MWVLKPKDARLIETDSAINKHVDDTLHLSVVNMREQRTFEHSEGHLFSYAGRSGTIHADAHY